MTKTLSLTGSHASSHPAACAKTVHDSALLNKIQVFQAFLSRTKEDFQAFVLYYRKFENHLPHHFIPTYKPVMG